MQQLSDVKHISVSIGIEQCRAGRALIGWSASELAEHAGIGVATVRRFEGGQPVQDGSLEAMRAALEAAGIEFIMQGQRLSAGGLGVRLKQS